MIHKLSSDNSHFSKPFYRQNPPVKSEPEMAFSFNCEVEIAFFLKILICKRGIRTSCISASSPMFSKQKAGFDKKRNRSEIRGLILLLYQIRLH